MLVGVLLAVAATLAVTLLMTSAATRRVVRATTVLGATRRALDERVAQSTQIANIAADLAAQRGIEVR